MNKTKTNRFISMLLTLAMLCSVFMSAVPVSAATTHNCGNAADCLVCEVAGMINALPAAEDITIDNAATVTNQIHAIDRIKIDLEDAEYEELLTLVEVRENEAGSALSEPARYMEAVEKVHELTGGGSLYVQKKFTAANGSVVDVTDAEVQVKITNTRTGAVAAELTLATLGTEVSALGADYYTANEDGWTYKYQLPAGTYEITEVSDSGATVNGDAFVTGSVSYNGETGESVAATLNDGDDTVISILNSNALEISVDSEITNGSITVATAAEPDTTVTVTATPDAGYVAGNVSVKRIDTGAEIEVYKDETVENIWTFTMPDTNVTVSATFVADSSENDTLPAGNYKIALRDVTDGTEDFTQMTDVNLELWEHIGDDVEDVLLDSTETNEKTYVEGNIKADGTQYLLRFNVPGYDRNHCWFSLDTLSGDFTENGGVYYLDISKIKTWYFYINDTNGEPVSSVYADVYADEEMYPAVKATALEKVVDQETGTTYWAYTPTEDEWLPQFYINIWTVQKNDIRDEYYFVPDACRWITEQYTAIEVYRYERVNIAAETEDGTGLGVTTKVYQWDDSIGEWTGGYDNSTDFIEGNRYKVIVNAGGENDTVYQPAAVIFTARSLEDYEFSDGVTGTYEYDAEYDEYDITITLAPETAQTVDYNVQLYAPGQGEFLPAGIIEFECTDNYAYSKSVDFNFESSALPVQLIDGKEYTLSVKPTDAYVIEPTDYPLTFIAGGDGSEFEGDSVYVFDNENNTIVINVLFEGDFYIPTGDAEVTINFKDREGKAMKVAGEYSVRHPYNSGVGIGLTQYELTDSLVMKNLGDGEYLIDINKCEYPDAGYQMYSGEVRFYIKDGKLVTEDVFDDNGDTIAEAPDAGTHIVKANTVVATGNTGSFDVEVGSYMSGFVITVPGLGEYLPYEVKDSEGTVVLSSEMELEGINQVFLTPGTYTLHSIADESLDEYVVFPAEDEYITFTIEDDYNITSADANVTIELYTDPRYVTWYLEPKKSMTVTVNASTTDGTAFKEYATISLYSNDSGDLIRTVEIPEGSTTFSKTWTVSSLSKNEYEDEYGETITDYVASEYYVEYSDVDVWEEIYEYADGHVFTVKVEGVGGEGGSGDEDEMYYIIGPANFDNGTLTTNHENDMAAAGEEVVVTIDFNDESVLETVEIATNDGTPVEFATVSEDAENGVYVYSFTMPADYVYVYIFTDGETPDPGVTTYPVSIKGTVKNGTVTADVTEAAEGDTVTLTVTPDATYVFESITVTDANGNAVTTTEVVADSGEAALFALPDPTVKTFTFAMPASEVTVDATFTRMSIESPFTVEAVVNTTTVDREAEETGDNADMDVYSGDKVYIDVVVNGADYTNADWTLVYDSSKFKYVETQQNADYGTLGYYVLDDSNADGNVLTGSISGVAGKTEDLDEFTDGEAVVTYVFEAIPQSKEVTGKFNITEAHANTYEMAGVQDNTAATSAAVDVTILLVDEDAAVDVPTGSIEDATVTYNALEQAGNEYVLDELFKDATVTYAANADGSPVTDTDGDGVVDADEVTGLTFRTGLPTWKNVGTYTYYVKVSGSGLATIYDSATLTITPATLTPSATFAVDPDVNKVTIVPVLEGVLDGTHNGTVTVKYTDVSGSEQTETLDASDFVYDGESTSVYNGTPIEVEAQASGTFTVTLDYTEGADDNYTGEENTATVDVDKITAEDATVEALEDTITNVFPYDSTAHGVVIDTDALAEITDGTWSATTIVDAYDETVTDVTVTNVGDERLVKVVFTDSTDVYNDVVVYVILKVTPADVRITIDNKTKAVGENDPEFTYTLEVLDEAGNVVTTNELYSADDLTALALELTREPGEAAGTYTITATYVPNANYNVTVIDGKLEIGAPATDGENPQVKIEVVDLSKGLTNGDVQPDYIADKRLILVYTDLDKAYYGYGTADNYEKFFDVTAAGYKYVDNNYTDGTYTEDATEYKHVYGIVVDKIDTYAATEDYEKQYLDKVIFLGSDAEDAPENIVYDADINLTEELDINDYSMNNGIYNTAYERATYIRSILKADYNHDKVVNTDDSLAVKGIVDVAVTVAP